MIRYTLYATGIESDPRHTELIAAECGVVNCKGVNTPGIRERGPDVGDDVAVKLEAASAYRGIVARGIYVGTERLGAKYATKELSRDCKTPTVGAVKDLKRMAQYYSKYPRLEAVYRWQGMRAGLAHIKILVAKADSNHANCPRTRRSTSGGVLMRGSHAWDSWSATQDPVCTSSGESEFMAIVKAATMLLGAVAMMLGLDLRLEAVVETDSSAGLGMASKVALQRTKHIDTKYLWAQQAIRQKKFKIVNIMGSGNAADLMRKHVGHNTMLKHLKALSMEFRAGSSSIAPRLLGGAARVRLQAVLMGCIIMQQFGETASGRAIQKMSRDLGVNEEVTFEFKEEQSNWGNVIYTILLLVGWELMKLFLEGLVQEKLLHAARKLKNKWFGVPQPELRDELEQVEQGLQAQEEPPQQQQLPGVEGHLRNPVGGVGGARPRIRTVMQTSNARTKKAKVHLYGDCHRLLACHRWGDCDVCWYCQQREQGL